MSADFSVMCSTPKELSSQPSPTWNKTTIIENGIAYLNQKNEELKLYQDLWDASMKVDAPKDSLPEKAREKYKSIARELKREIKLLSKKVVSLLFIESDQDLSSQQTQKLLNIASVAQHGLNYFNSVIEATSEQTLSNKLMKFRQEKPSSRNPVLTKVASYANSLGLVGLSTVAYSIYHNAPISALIMSFTSIAAYSGLIYIRDTRTKIVYELSDTEKSPLSWNLTFGNEPTAVKVGTMKNFFQKALSGEKVLDYIHIPNEKIIDDKPKPTRFEYTGSRGKHSWSGSSSYL
jgi:hypothetical protein